MSGAEIYDPMTGKFSGGRPLNDGRFKLPDEAVRLASGKLLVAGGIEVGPARGPFSVVGGMSDSWHYMSETRLSDGRVLLAGGYANSDQATQQDVDL